MVEFWLITLLRHAWTFTHDHIKNTQQVIYEEQPSHFFLTVISTFFLWAIGINYINTIFYTSDVRDKDIKIANLKKELRIKTSQYEQEKAKKNKRSSRKDPCHPELDWASLSLVLSNPGSC